MSALQEKSTQQLIIEAFDFDSQHHIAALEHVAGWTVGHCVASPLSEAGEMRHLLAAVAIDEERTVCGYGAIKRVWAPGVVELGGLIVADGYEGRGGASGITENVVGRWRQLFPEDEVMAFANPASTAVFEKLGGVVLGTKQEYLVTRPPDVPYPIDPNSLTNLAIDLTDIG
jgi:hypothetical protein